MSGGGFMMEWRMGGWSFGALALLFGRIAKYHMCPLSFGTRRQTLLPLNLQMI